MKKMEDSPCLLSLLLYRPNLKNIYETRPFKTACTGCTKNGCNIIWTFAGSRMSRANRALMITDSNQVCFAKMTGRRVQEEVLSVDLTYKEYK
jgi:hypothetical protein